MRAIITLAVFFGIPALFVMIHSANHSDISEPTQSTALVPSYEKENIERCFFWVDENNNNLENKVE